MFGRVDVAMYSRCECEFAYFYDDPLTDWSTKNCSSRHCLIVSCVLILVFFFLNCWTFIISTIYYFFSKLFIYLYTLTKLFRCGTQITTLANMIFAHIIGTRRRNAHILMLSILLVTIASNPIDKIMRFNCVHKYRLAFVQQSFWNVSSIYFFFN